MSQLPKVLLLYAHPESQDSIANRVLLQPAQQLSHVTVHDLYAHYPDFFIDIHHEQQLLRGASNYRFPASPLYLELPGIVKRVAGSRAVARVCQWAGRQHAGGKITGAASSPPVSRKRPISRMAPTAIQ
ncbi:General stress protein 14 [Mixta intestinalis]|uniref:General stress protein 14 n=1 Tax=Mixta intestinalis TaxID=1615494 RepID=A0A6P1Q568_9GAMM|nr:General stress protein 14 [Mixta intestinalis]